MGFISPGKSLKSLKRLSAQEHSSKRKRRNHGSSLKPKTAQSTEQTIHNEPHRKLTINHLPINLMYKIFLLAGPNNNLPLLNKSMYANLQFNGERGGSSDIDTNGWPHYSLALQMIKMYFVADLNTRLNSVSIEKKIKYYESCFDRLNRVHMEVERSAFYPRLLVSLKQLKDLWGVYNSVVGRYVIDASILNYRFVSDKLLWTLNSNTFGDESERQLLRYKSRNDIYMNRKLRLMFLRFKFAEIDALAKRVHFELRTESFAHTSMYDDFNKYLEFINGKDESDLNNELDPLGKVLENPALSVYEDEEATGGSEFKKDEVNFYNFIDGTSCGHVYFGEVESNQNQFTIPNHIYIKSISSLRYFKVLNFLLVQPRKKPKPDYIINEILEAREMDEYSGKNLPYLNEVKQIIFND